MAQNNFHYALVLANNLYDLEVNDEDKTIEIGLMAWTHIGNKNTVLKRDRLKVNEKGFVELPCDCDKIEAITADFEDFNRTSNLKDHGDLRSHYIEQYIEGQKASTDPFYMSGRFIKYTKSGNKLFIEPGIKEINILYKTVLRDEEGLPFINDKEALAIADYITYITKYKEAIRTNNLNVMKMASDLKQSWLFHCDAARVPESISQNEMDRMLNVHAACCRKFYGKSFKPLM